MKRLILAALIALPFVSSATTFTCKAIQEGQIDSGSQNPQSRLVLMFRTKV